MVLAEVERIGQLTADVVIRQADKRSTAASVVHVPTNADAGTVIRNALNSPSSKLVSFVAHNYTRTSLTRLLWTLSAVQDQPLVVSLPVIGQTADLTDALILRAAVPYFIVSYTAQDAVQHALLAAKLAVQEHKAVVHAFYDAAAPHDGESPLSDESIRQLVHDRPHTNGVANGNGNGIHSEPTEDEKLFTAYQKAALQVATAIRRPVHPWHEDGASDEPHTVIFTVGLADIPFVPGVSTVALSLLSPLPAHQLTSLVPTSATHVVVLEQISQWSGRRFPVYLDVVAALQGKSVQLSSGQLGRGNITAEDVSSLSSRGPVSLGGLLSSVPTQNGVIPTVPAEEDVYTHLLDNVFGDRLNIVNTPSSTDSSDVSTTPEYALGKLRAIVARRQDLVKAVKELMIQSPASQLHTLLGDWLAVRDDFTKSSSLATQLVDLLLAAPESSTSKLINRILALKSDLVGGKSHWIIGSDAWAHDIGASGLHHVLASSLDVNILMIDSLEPGSRKQDAGLYAMNRGDVYAASVAIYSSHGGTMRAFSAADTYKGPSLILALLPRLDNSSPLALLKASQHAVASGAWPLYRWSPSKDGGDFALDSDKVKNDLAEFMDRQNHLSQLVAAGPPRLAPEVTSSLGSNFTDAISRKRAYDALLGGLAAGGSGTSLRVLFASDGGVAEKLAKRLINRAQARGVSTSIDTLDSTSPDTLAAGESADEVLAFITSTAGQGEPPQNGRKFFKALNASKVSLENLSFTVFGLGDSHYWPRPEDAGYYNRPGKDLDSRVEALGANRVTPLGLGDDQDADGYMTGYKVWEPLLWKALGVDGVAVDEAEPEPITNENIKAASNYLRGTIAEGLEDTSTGALDASDGQLTKFHGIYQQDDRDIREDLAAEGKEPAFSFMIRVRLPGGVCTADQWLAIDRIADERGNGTFKITTRQTFQFHGIIKRHLKPSMQAINRSLLDTIAACGDVNRNVVCSAIPSLSELHAQVHQFCITVSERLLPRTTAYHEIWMDKKLVGGQALKDFEPLYGPLYLPRKFKIAVAVPPQNDVDVFANDVGYIAIVDKSGKLLGFNVSIGGGMGVTHGNKKTYPRTGTVIGFCTVEQGPEVAEKIMLVQKEHGNRADRKNARLKYTVDRLGVDAYKSAVEDLLGYSLASARPYTFDRNTDDFGWAKGSDGRHHFTMFIENGRVQDEKDKLFKTGLAELAKVHKGTFRLTTNQHLVISDIEEAELDLVKSILRKYNMDGTDQSALRKSSSACVAFPTCGLAMAESERYLPLLVDKVEKICEDNGLRNDAIVMRMTGCPNGCARPYVAEIAFVGKAPGTYSMLLGGGFYGQRLNKIYRETVTEPEILAILKPMIGRYAKERLDGEKFGDFVIRAGYIAATTEGKEWYDRMGGEGVWRQVA